MPFPVGRDAWEDLAARAALAYVRSVGAAVWPEVEARLAETDWVHQRLDPDVPPDRGPDPHHLTTARRRLLRSGEIDERPARLTGRTVNAYLDADTLSKRGRKTELEKTAGRKRRLYRSYLGWASNPSLCGGIAERVVEATLGDLSGPDVVTPRDARRGNVRTIEGREIPGGPLDAAGALVLRPDRLTAGIRLFGVEVKNVRKTLYPWHEEIWDLIAKLGTFPEVTPLLVARRIHYMTFRFFSDIGAFGFRAERQWFSGTGRIAQDRFERVRSGLGFHDLVMAADPPRPHQPLRRFFTNTLRADQGGRTRIEAAAERWQIAAPIVAKYEDLREDLDTDERRERWTEVAEEIDAAGLYRPDEKGGWAPADFDV
jgi:hypothetical protein